MTFTISDISCVKPADSSHLYCSYLSSIIILNSNVIIQMSQIIFARPLTIFYTFYFQLMKEDDELSPGKSSISTPHYLFCVSFEITICNVDIPTGDEPDQEFEPSADMLVHEYDDEQTLAEEEEMAIAGGEDPQCELNSLQKVGSFNSPAPGYCLSECF